MGYRLDGHDERQLAIALWQHWGAKDMKAALPRPNMDWIAKKIVERTPSASDALLDFIDMRLAAPPRDMTDAEKAMRELEMIGLRFRLGQLF